MNFGDAKSNWIDKVTLVEKQVPCQMRRRVWRQVERELKVPINDQVWERICWQLWDNYHARHDLCPLLRYRL